MIKNSKQLAIEKKEVADLVDIIKDMDKLSREKKPDTIQQLQYDLYKGRIEELKNEIAEYERLASDKLDSLVFNSSIDDLNKAIISYRIASGLTQKNLADKLEIHEQQIQRYEHQEYLKASFERVLQILKTLNVEVHFKKEFRDKRRIIDPNKFLIPTKTKENLSKVISLVSNRQQLFVAK
jgi:transcriptional regulator with XRE-family HTH domain